MDKAAARRVSLERRAGLSPEARAAASARAADHAAGVIAGRPGLVSLFLPIRDEIDTWPLIHLLHAAGRRLALPAVPGRGKPLPFRLWAPGEPLVEGPWGGIPEPPPTAEEVEPDIVVVPLAAFDLAGGRIGYGAGHYDRSLERLRAAKPILAIGYAFAAQRLEAVPVEPHDQPLDVVVTEDGVVWRM